MDIGAAAMAVQRAQISRDADPRAARLRRVFERSAERLFRHILVRIAGDTHAAEELLQEVCRVAVEHRRVPAEDAECEAWMFGIARNLIRKHWRDRRRRRVQQPIEDADAVRELAEDMAARPLPPEVLERQETVSRLLSAVAGLPAADRELLLAVYFDGRSQQDLAAEAGTTVKSVECRLYRARQRLRAVMTNSERMSEP